MTVFLRDHPTRFALIAQMSPAAHARMNGELFLTAVESDEITEEGILEDLLLNMLRDLQEIGIEFHCNLHDLYDNYYQLDQFLHLVKFFLPAPLYTLILTDNKIRQALQAILEGNVSNEAAVRDYAKWIGIENERYAEEHGQIVEKVLPYLHSTPRFVTYITNMAAMLGNTPVLPDLNNDGSIEKFHEMVVEIDATLSDIMINTQVDGLTEEDMRKLQRRVVLFIQNLTSPENTNLYAILFASDIPADVYVEKAKRIREFTAGSKFHLEYYAARNLAPTLSDIFGLLSYIAATTRTRLDFSKKVQTLTEYASERGIDFTPPILSFISLASAKLKMRFTE